MAEGLTPRTLDLEDRNLFSWPCIDIVKRNMMSITLRIWSRVKRTYLNPVLEKVSTKYLRSSSVKIQLFSMLSGTPVNSPPDKIIYNTVKIS